jgi:hypothetical protein
MAQLDFHLAGHVMRVEGPDAALMWLEEFLTPQFPVIRCPDPDRTIRFIVDSREHGQLLARGPLRLRGRVECFTLDTGILSAALWNAQDDSPVAFDEAAHVFYRRPRSAPRVVEAVAEADTGPARVALMRIVREFAMMYAARAGWLLVHGAAAQVGDGAVVIAGPKRAGKTTLLLHSLLHERGAYISNDRVAIRLEGTDAFVQGIPTIVSLRGGSTAWFPALETALAGGQYNYRLLLQECRVTAARAPLGRPATWGLSPRQLCHLLAVDSRASERVSALLFPKILGEPGATALEELPIDRAQAALRSALLRPFPRDGMFRIDGVPDADAHERVQALTARLVSGVPSFSCHLGADAYTEDSGWLRRLAHGLSRREARL